MEIKKGYYRPWVYGTPVQIAHVLYIIEKDDGTYAVYYASRTTDNAEDKTEDNDREVKSFPTAAQAQTFLNYLAVTILEMTEKDHHWTYQEAS